MRESGMLDMARTLYGSCSVTWTVLGQVRWLSIASTIHFGASRPDKLAAYLR
jgi:hypothetical protein